MQLKMSVNEIKNLVASSDISSYPSLAESLYTDNRKQVKTIACSLMKKYDKYVLEQKRIDRLKLVENDFYAKGIKLIAGIDEAGRGPLCGPVVSAAVIMPQQSRIPKINDSKKLSSESRDKLYESITESAVAWAVGDVYKRQVLALVPFASEIIRHIFLRIFLCRNCFVSYTVYCTGNYVRI